MLRWEKVGLWHKISDFAGRPYRWQLTRLSPHCSISSLILCYRVIRLALRKPIRGIRVIQMQMKTHLITHFIQLVEIFTYQYPFTLRDKYKARVNLQDQWYLVEVQINFKQ